MVEPKLLAKLADFVLEKVSERLNELKVHILWQAAHVVVAFDYCGVFGAALDNIWINGSLEEVINIFQLAGFFFKNTDKLFADDLALAFRIIYAGQLAEEAVFAVYTDKVHLKTILENMSLIHI